MTPEEIAAERALTTEMIAALQHTLQAGFPEASKGTLIMALISLASAIALSRSTDPHKDGDGLTRFASAAIFFAAESRRQELGLPHPYAEPTAPAPEKKP